MQQAQRHGEVVHQIFDLLPIVAGQALGQALEGVFQVAVVVERLDQKAQRGAVAVIEAQAQGLAVQMRLQRLLHAGQFGSVFVFVVAQVIGFGFGVATPFAVVGRGLGAAVAFPAHAIVAAGLGRQGRGLVIAAAFAAAAGGAAVVDGGALG